MLDLEKQMALQRLVSPGTRLPLVHDGISLRTADGRHVYPVVCGVPILLSDPCRITAALAAQDGAMVWEYEGPPPRRLRGLYQRLLAAPGDQRTRASQRAFEGLFTDLPADALCLSIGGGPRRIRPEFVNLNLAAFPNVDIVADAYELPYADGAVDLVHCEAVLEHLEYPDRAAAEMYRVLRPSSGKAFIATPFLQPYHGYPDHFQNFTLSGHRRLFERAGFRIREAGTCVGPIFALRDLFLNLVRTILPGGGVGRWLARLSALLTLPFLYFDRIAGERAGSSTQASSTYLLLERKEEAASGGALTAPLGAARTRTLPDGGRRQDAPALPRLHSRRRLRRRSRGPRTRPSRRSQTRGLAMELSPPSAATRLPTPVAELPPSASTSRRPLAPG